MRSRSSGFLRSRRPSTASEVCMELPLLLDVTLFLELDPAFLRTNNSWNVSRLHPQWGPGGALHRRNGEAVLDRLELLEVRAELALERLDGPRGQALELRVEP